MASTFELSGQPHLQDLVGQSGRDDPSTHRQDVGVVVLAGEFGGEQIVAQCRSGASNFVGRELLGQVDIFAAEPLGRSIRADLIPFHENITIRRGDILIAGVGQIGVSGNDVAQIAPGGQLAGGTMAGKEDEHPILTLHHVRIGQLVA